MNWVFWKAERGLLNWERPETYSRVESSAKAAPPTEQVAMLILPPSRPAMAIPNPWPSSPTLFSSPTTTSSSCTTQVGCEFHPSFTSGLPKLTPSWPFSTKKQEIPLALSTLGSVRAITTYTSLVPAPEMKALAPFRT